MAKAADLEVRPGFSFSQAGCAAPCRVRDIYRFTLSKATIVGSGQGLGDPI